MSRATGEGSGGSSHAQITHRLLLPVLVVIAAVVAIEFGIQLVFHPSFWQKTTWLMHDPYRFQGEVADRDFTFQKIRWIEDSDPEIISVGDSSGFFSLQSKIVNRYISGHKYLSLNTGANDAYVGYKGLAEYMLRRSPHLRYVVLYLYPQILPAEIVLDQADLGLILNDDFVGMNSVITPPSAGLSAYAKSLVFKGKRFHLGDPLSLFSAAYQYWATAKDTIGWLPEFDVRFDRTDTRRAFPSDQRSPWYHRKYYRFNFAEPSMINLVLDDFARMVQSYGAQLAIAFGPFPKRLAAIGDPNIAAAEQALARFQREHPDVKFLFPLITRWGTEKFGMYNHVSREYTFLSSERMGKALAQILNDPDSIKPFTPAYQDPGSYPAVETKAMGPPDKKLLDAALALYLYTSTADETYRQLISKRVLNLIDNDSAFRYMMDDARTRVASLTRRGITIGFNLATLQATPVTVTGMDFCTGPDDQWVYIDGNMIFSYQSDAYSDTGAVPWPASSHILIPTIVEDGVPKFDGYCPEPSMDDAPAAGR
jgi:hypothetical protein